MASIVSFFPNSGEVGRGVTVNGTHLDTVTQVLFNATRAATFFREGGRKLLAKVPKGATTGKIIVIDEKGQRAESHKAFIVD